MSDWEEDFNFQGGDNADPLKPKKPVPKSHLESILPLDVPLGASDDDTRWGEDDAGFPVYRTATGRLYTVRPATEEERDQRQPLGVKVRKWWDEGANLPSGEEVLSALAGMPQAYAEAVQRVVDGTGTYADLLGSVGPTTAPGIVSRVGTALDPSVVSAMGATHKVPRYKQKPPVLENPVVKGAPTPEQPETFDDEGFLQIDEPVQAEREFVDADTFFGLNPENPFVPTYFPPPKEEFLDTPFIQFRDPLDEILSEMEIPPKGITGAQLLKELQDNPTVRMAQLRSQGILDRIDPAKRYGPVDQVRPLLLEGKYTVQAVPQNRYDSYQRQPVADKELNYVEYAINADKDGPTFKANSQHYQSNTLAHVRLSERENPAGNYVLIEELQSDLLQQGYRKPSKDPFVSALQELETRWLQDYPNEGVDTGVVRAFTPEDLQEYRSLDAVVGLEIGGPDGGKEALQNVENFVEALSYDPRFKGAYPHILKDWLYRLDFYEKQALPETRLPPITKMEESVRLGLETAIAHAAQNNIDRVVIPPFHRIVEQRFTKGSADYDKAMDPKSGFYQTYVGAVNKVLKKLNEDMGADVEVREFDLTYKDAFDNTPIVDFLDSQTSRSMAVLSNAMFKLRTYGGSVNWTPEEKLAYLDFRDKVREVVPNFQMGDFKAILDTMEDDRSLYTFARKLTPLETPPYDPGLEINFSNAIKNGYDLTRPRFAEGGVVENQNLSSVNAVPPGATPKEVADDVPIMASEGEYVIPANVVRFLGLDKIEKMVDQAKMKLAELDQKGRIGGDTGEQDDLPFSPEELQRAPAGDAEIPGMAEGGMVSDPNMQIDPATGLPLWLLQMQNAPQASAPTPTVSAPPVASPMASAGPSMKRESDRDRGFEVNLTGTAQSVAKWSPDEFNKYARTRGNTGQALGSAVTAMVPFGGIGARMRGNYLERAVPRGFDTMLETGRDLQGNPLTADQITELRTSYDRVKSTPKPLTGVMGAVRGLAEDTGLVRRREPTAEREPRRLRDVFSGGSSSSPKVSGDGLVSRPDKKKESGGQKASTNSTNGKTSSKKK